MSYRDKKVEMFAERDSVDEALEYAKQIGGQSAVIASMVMFNTLLEALAKEEETKQHGSPEVTDTKGLH